MSFFDSVSNAVSSTVETISSGLNSAADAANEFMSRAEEKVASFLDSAFIISTPPQTQQPTVSKSYTSYYDLTTVNQPSWMNNHNNSF